jgi:hypothetical protein|tara:strand:- start:922 stop:1638 length:717 start_codon:yes stop_codon:yes gene_type:complete
MPLPSIATPTYSLILPSTKEEITYRPFLVREEKLLVLALEGEDQKEISTAIKSVLQACVKSKIDIQKLPTFDIEYLFLNIRGKSVGEEVEVNIIAPDDGKTSIPVKINLDDISVKEFDDHDKFIKLDDNLMMEMKYPSLDQFIQNNFDFSVKSSTEQTFDLVAGCIDKVYNDEETWDAGDFSKKEMSEFLDQMNSQQFKKVEKFFETMPKLSHEITVKNPKTKKSSKVVLEGLSSFFA